MRTAFGLIGEILERLGGSLVGLPSCDLLHDPIRPDDDLFADAFELILERFRG